MDNQQEFEGLDEMIAESAREVINRASDEVLLRGHHLLMPEHLLRAIAERDRPLFDREMESLNVEPAAVIQKLDARLAMPQDTSPGRCRIAARSNGVEVPTFPAPCSRVIHTAYVEVYKQGRRLIESRDILFGLCHGWGSIMYELMDIEEAETDSLAKKIFELMTGPAATEGSEELARLLKDASEEVQAAALQKAGALQRANHKDASEEVRATALQKIASLRRANRDTLRCSFCAKSQNEVKKLIAGPTVYICNECIDICNEIVADDQRSF